MTQIRKEEVRIVTSETAAQIHQLLSVLPEDIVSAYRRLSPAAQSRTSEIRLRDGLPCSFTVGGENVCISEAFGQQPRTSSQEELRDILFRMCEGSLYAYSESLRQGFLSFGGTRVGVSGTLVTENGRVTAMSRVMSLNIRVARSLPDAANVFLGTIREKGVDASLGVLVVSPPNGGKTTFLRSLASGLSRADGPYALRVCLCDEREELYLPSLFRSCLCDVLTGCPKAKAVEMATRTLSPQVLVCDEIGGDEEADALCRAFQHGVYLALSLHGTTMRDVRKKEGVAKLIETGALKTAVFLRRTPSGIEQSAVDLSRMSEDVGAERTALSCC